MLYHGKEKGKNLTFKARKGRGKRSEVEKKKKSWGRWERLWRAEEKWEAGEVAGPET